MNRYDLAIFDFDGTLADRAEWFFAACDGAAARFGLRR
jgi:phosphoglycolate phosphatase